MMQSIQWILLRSCLLGVFIPFSRTSVVLEIVGGKTTFPEGSKVELLCTISSYNNLMTWYVNNDVYAGCLAGSCAPSANKEYTFIFDFYQSSKNFTLTIDSVNSSHAALVFACDDGNERKTIKFTVTTVNKPSESDGPFCDSSCIILLKSIFGPIGGVIGLFGLFFLVIIILHCREQPKFTKIELEDTEIYLEWTDSLNFCSAIFRYNIVCIPKHGQVKDLTSREEFTKKTHCTLDNLDPMAIYEISLSRKLCCFKSSATQISVITRKAGMLNDQGYVANSTSMVVNWTKPACISKPHLQYKITCNGVNKGTTGNISYTINDLITYKPNEIEVSAINDGNNSLLFAEKISATPKKVCLEKVSYGPGNTSVECNIRWTVSHKQESDEFLFNIICRSKEEQVHEKGITDSSYTIPELYPDRSYTVYVYAIYNSIQLEPPCKIKLAPYILTWDSEPTSKSTEIELKWKRPEYTGDKPLTYEVTYNKGNEEIVDKTSEISYTIKNLEPSQTYDVWIFTIINEGNGMKSLPLQRKIRTQPFLPPVPYGQQRANNNVVNTFEASEVKSFRKNKPACVIC